ncbi:MAG: dienelactone hydrolase family protein [Candidatus Korobacteraceae bacterium]
MPEITAQYVDLSVDDGTTMRAWFALPQAGAPKAGLIVFQEAFGVNSHIRDVTDRFAKLGYAALAPELYHRVAPGFEGKYDDMASVMPIAKQTTTPGLQSDVRASHQFLLERFGDLVACVGYCMGGRVSFLANTTVPLKAAISYYGAASGEMLALAGKNSAPMLFYWGGQDKHIGPDQRRQVSEAMRASPKPWAEVIFSDADHGFFCDQRPSYNPRSAQLSWTLMQSFLDQYLSQ